MARFNANRINYAEQERLLTKLCTVLQSLHTTRAKRDFLKDLLNRHERAMLVRRLLIAERLLRGKTYAEIKTELNVGSSTIARVDRWLHFGRDGYKRAIRALRKDR